jgi:hypothetical protein
MARTLPVKKMPERESENFKTQRDLTAWTKVVGVATVLLVLANAVALFFIYQQWRTSADTQIDTREQLRAVISLQPWGVIIFPNGAKQNYAFVENFQNVGGTRTDHFSGWLSVKFFESGIPNNIDLTKPAVHLDVTYSVIGPNSPLQVGVALSEDEAEKFANKNITGTALLWGEAEYSDIFDPHTVHKIRVCKTVTRPFDSEVLKNGYDSGRWLTAR